MAPGATAFVAQPGVRTVSFACPSCGTDYARKLARLERLPAKVRCHRCGTVWDPASPAPVAVPEAAPLAAAPTIPAPPTLRPATHPGARLLWLATVCLVLLGLGGFAVAFRDLLPFHAGPVPVLADVAPVWTEAADGPRLTVTASVVNAAGADATVDRVHVKFLSARGAWAGDALVEVPPTDVPAGGTVPIAFTVASVPSATASLEFVVLPRGAAVP